MIELTNLVPDPTDPRDYMFEPDLTAVLPVSVDLRPYCSNMEDQLTVGSCTANATCSNAEMFLKAGNKLVDMSRLFNYFTSRSYLPVEYQQNDLGSSERMALKAARNFGIAQESIWPYDANQVNTPPSATSYNDALNYQAGGYFRISTLSPNIQAVIKYALACGYPVLAGLRIGEKMRDLPPNEEYGYINSLNPYWGNHELLVVGYDKDYFFLQNSWGVSWGTDGFFKAIQGVLAVDVIDLWVLKGFSGVERVGQDF
ncbi:MAG: C1 family peptidase, partial [Minisyncoccota bacterium]